MRLKILLLLTFTLILQAKTYKDVITDFEIVKVVDGDTFIININNIYDVFGNNIAVRIRGIDTPERKDKRQHIRELSIKAKYELEHLLYNAKSIELYNIGRDKYFRLLASVRVDNKDVAKHMIIKGYAKKYNGGKKEW